MGLKSFRKYHNLQKAQEKWGKQRSEAMELTTTVKLIMEHFQTFPFELPQTRQDT